MAGNEENQKWAKEMKGPSSDKVELLTGAGKQRTAHIRGQKNTNDELLDHDRQMGNRKVLDTYEMKARARPRHHQPVPSQYRA